MLVLTRREGEQVFIDMPDGTRVIVFVVAWDRGKIRLGFDGPQEVKFLRSELEKEPK